MYNSPVTRRRLQTPFTRQTNTATPSRVTENYYKVQDKTLSMGVSSGAAAISIYNCGRQSDRQTDSCVSRPEVTLQGHRPPGYHLRLYLAPLFSPHPQAAAGRRECLVLSYCDSPDSSCGCELAACDILRTDFPLHFSEILRATGWVLSLWHSGLIQRKCPNPDHNNTFFWIRSTLFIINVVCYKIIIIIQLFWHYIDFFWTQTWI